MAKEVTILMTDESFARLERLRTMTDAAGLHEVIGNSIRIYEVIVEASELGGQVLVNKDGSAEPVSVFGEHG